MAGGSCPRAVPGSGIDWLMTHLPALLDGALCNRVLEPEEGQSIWTRIFENPAPSELQRNSYDMPPTTLVDAIKNVRARIDEFKTQLAESELRTRASLIDPVLTALEWDTADPAKVTIEWKVGEGRADYALKGDSARPLVIIEAKKLGTSLQPSYWDQILQYAVRERIRYAAITNGDRWQLYDVRRRVYMDKKLMLDVSIAGEASIHQCALELLVLWRPVVDSTPPIESNRPIVPATEQHTVPATKQHTVPATKQHTVPVTGQHTVPVTGQHTVPATEQHTVPATEQHTVPVTGQHTVPVSDDWTPLSDFDYGGSNALPTAIRFPDESQESIQYWKDILRRTADWLSDEELITKAKLPLKFYANSANCLMNNEPVHPNGRDFFAPYRIKGSPLVLETNFSAAAILRYSRKLLEACYEDPTEVYLGNPKNLPAELAS